MFDFSFGKLIILFALCLVVLGPEKLPKLAAQLGRFAGQARAMARHFRSQLEQEIAAEDLKREMRAATEAINKIGTETIPSVTNPVSEAVNTVTTEVSGMQAAAKAAIESHDIANLDLGFDPNAPVVSALPEENLPPHAPMLEHETVPTPLVASDKTTTTPV
jgi:sec-independent protein translocase protein TatB